MKLLENIFIMYCEFILVPPAHDPQQDHPPQQTGYLPQEGYQPFPPQQAYPPPTKGYVPPPGGGYDPISAGQTNVMIATAPEVRQTTLIREERPKVNHVLHLLITIFLFPPWLFVWIILCAIYGCD